MGEADDAGAERMFAVAFGETGDEAAVNLDDVDLEGVELRERGIACAEVVEGEADAGGAEVGEPGTIRLSTVEEDALGDFDDDCPFSKPSARNWATQFGSLSPSARNCTGERLMLIWKVGSRLARMWAAKRAASSATQSPIS